MKTSELSGPYLDRAVAECQGQPVYWNTDDQALYCGHGDPNFMGMRGDCAFTPSTDWSQGGPIIEQANLSVLRLPQVGEAQRWWATASDVPDSEKAQGQHGRTPLVAAMRCYVASKLGDEVDLWGGLA